MKIISTILTVITFALPVASTAHIATTTGSGLSISSDFVEQVRNLEGEEVDHAPVSLYMGVRKRFSSSQSGVADLSITPQLVLNAQLLELYVRKVALTHPIEELEIKEDEIVAVLKGPAQLFGLVKVQVPYEIRITYDSKLKDISSDSSHWWSFLTRTQSADQITSDIKSQLEDVRYLSRIQLRAYLLEAIVKSVQS